MNNKMYIKEVLDVLDTFEEISGPNGKDYIEVMQAIKNEIEIRIKNCNSWLKNEVENE
tara:strand:+ start:27 stop:200 length:174 start_codon:yes stop_codon:yes gene_type:complete